MNTKDSQAHFLRTISFFVRNCSSFMEWTSPAFSLESLKYVNVVVNDTDEWFQPRVYTSIAISLFSVAAMNERDDLLFILNLPCAACARFAWCAKTTQDRTQWCGNKRNNNNANKIQTENMQTLIVHGTHTHQWWVVSRRAPHASTSTFMERNIKSWQRNDGKCIAAYK